MGAEQPVDGGRGDPGPRPPTPLGQDRPPGVWFQLGDPASPAGWEHLTAVLRHFGPE